MKFKTLFIILAIALLVAPVVEAKDLSDRLKDMGADSVEFIQDNPRIMDFAAFAIFLCAVLWLALSKVGGEGSNWGKWAAILFGLVLAAVAVATGLSVVKFLGSYVTFLILLGGAIGVFLLMRLILPKNPLAAFLVALVLVVIGVGVLEYTGMTDLIPDFGKNKYARMTFNEVKEEINIFAAEYNVNVSDIDTDPSLNEWRKLDMKIERIRNAINTRLGQEGANKDELKSDLRDLSDLRDFGSDLARRIDRFKEKAEEYRAQLQDILRRYNGANQTGNLTEDLREQLLDEYNKLWLKFENLVKVSGGIVNLEPGHEITRPGEDANLSVQENASERIPR